MTNFLRSKGAADEIESIKSDDDASFAQTFYYNAAELDPQIAGPYEIDNVHSVGEVEGKAVDQYI